MAVLIKPNEQLFCWVGNCRNNRNQGDPPSPCPPKIYLYCKLECINVPDDWFEMEKNAPKRPRGWKRWLWWRETSILVGNKVNKQGCWNICQGRLTTLTNISTSLLRLPPQRRGYWRNWLKRMPPSLPPTMNCRPLWLSSLNPMSNSFVGLATAATTATKGILLRLAPPKYISIANWNA